MLGRMLCQHGAAERRGVPGLGNREGKSGKWWPTFEPMIGELMETSLGTAALVLLWGRDASRLLWKGLSLEVTPAFPPPPPEPVTESMVSLCPGHGGGRALPASPCCLPPKPNDRSPSLPGPFPTCFLIPCKLTLPRTWPSPQLVCPLGQDKEWRAAWASPAQPPDAFRKATRKQQETGLQSGPLVSWSQGSFCSGSKECSGFFSFGLVLLIFLVSRYLQLPTPPLVSPYHSAHSPWPAWGPSPPGSFPGPLQPTSFPVF